ncbi:MAG: hypothetical protein HC824_11350 [Synechococcales cyanobacterium RM1_1_8]|nr:hypothetical protein [Synechococcales cyanobacterium RM1_1_8]
MSERLDRIEQLLEASLKQRDQDRRDWLERDRQLSERLNQTDQQQTQFWEGLSETKALQQRNAEAISQQLELISQMRQAMNEQNRQIQGNRADIARLDREDGSELN